MFEPRYIKHSHLLLRHAEKLIRYRRDRLNEAAVTELRGQMEKLRVAMKARDQQTTHEEAERLDKLLTEHTPPPKDAVWREKRRGDSGRDRGGDRHPFLFHPALQNPDRLHAADLERNHRSSFRSARA